MQTPLEQYRQALTHSRVRGRSPREFVEIVRDERGEISVHIEPGTFRELTHRELTDEIRDALVTALADYAATADRLYRRWDAD